MNFIECHITKKNMFMKVSWIMSIAKFLILIKLKLILTFFL